MFILSLARSGVARKVYRGFWGIALRKTFLQHFSLTPKPSLANAEPKRLTQDQHFDLLTSKAQDS